MGLEWGEEVVTPRVEENGPWGGPAVAWVGLLDRSRREKCVKEPSCICMSVLRRM